MPVYTAHGPVRQTANRPSSDRVVFVRDGFSFWAFLFGPLWLIRHRLWLALVAYLAALGGTVISMNAAGVPSVARMAVLLLIALLMGLEASSLRRWTLSRGKWRQLDIVVGDDQDAAERRFFDRWRGGVREEPMDRGAPPPSRSSWREPRASAAHDDIIGLFPQPHGAPR